MLPLTPPAPRVVRLAECGVVAVERWRGPAAAAIDRFSSSSSSSRHLQRRHQHSTDWTRQTLGRAYLPSFRLMATDGDKMLRLNKRMKPKRRLKELSFRDKQNPALKNIEVAGILSEILPIAAGVYNTAYFVIINQKKHTNLRSSEPSGNKRKL